MKKEDYNKTPRQNFHELSLKAKLRYLFDYYKFHFIVICIIIYIPAYFIYGHFTHKDAVLYVGLANINTGEDTSAKLTSEYLLHENIDTKKNEIYLYNGLYISNNPSAESQSYSFASSTKLLAAIDSEEMDVVLMNDEALKIFSDNNYLAELDTLVPEKYMQDNSSKYAIPLSSSNMLKAAGIEQNTYIGILANSPRKQEALNYIDYILTN